MDVYKKNLGNNPPRIDVGDKMSSDFNEARLYSLVFINSYY